MTVSVRLPDGGVLSYWIDLTAVTLPHVTFDSYYRFADETLVSTSVLRFRERDEVIADLATAGFTVGDVRDAPDRPGRKVRVRGAVVIGRISRDPR